MQNKLTEDTNTTLLLCAVFGKDSKERPLTQTEYNALVRYLVSNELRPRDLLDKADLQEVATASKLGYDRLAHLLDRGVQLGFAVEEWQRSGIWIVGRSDADYPSRYREHLRNQAPPILFGAGSRLLLKGGGLAVVGSRDVDEAGSEFTRQIGARCGAEGCLVVSGGAKGVDRLAMNAALSAGGKTVGVLADNLLKYSVEREARTAISEERLLLISPYHPKARFTAGTAMARNRLIYAMADYALVVSTTYNKGGTWNGAIEELKRSNSRTVFVRIDQNAPSGNKKLLQQAAIPWPENLSEDKSLMDSLTKEKDRAPGKTDSASLSLFDSKPSYSNPASDLHTKTPNRSIYQAVLPIILESLGQGAQTATALATTLDLQPDQLNSWLEMAVQEGRIVKSGEGNEALFGVV